jgi:hypothetical protein
MTQTGIRLDAADEAFMAPWVVLARRAMAPEEFEAAERDARALPHDRAVSAARKWLEGGMN